MVRSWKYPTTVGRAVRPGQNRSTPAWTMLVPLTRMLCTEYCTSCLDSALSAVRGQTQGSQVVPDGLSLVVWPVLFRTLIWVIRAGSSAAPCWSVKCGVTGHRAANAAVTV